MGKRASSAPIPVEPVELMVTSEVALMLRRSPDTLREWRADGIGPVFYRDEVTGAIWYRSVDVHAWLATLRVEPAT